MRKGVFISYARADGEAFACSLRELLLQHDLSVWRDREHMQGGRDWWLQITDALNHVEYMVLVMTPAALASELVRREWRYARQQGVEVVPVISSPTLELESLPRWMRDVHWYDLTYQRKRFINDLNQRPQMRRVPFMAEPPAAHFVSRDGELQRLKALLLSANRAEPVAITAALRGAGGYGKTTLARALCADDDVQSAFDDGILWVTLGELPGVAGLLSKLIDLIETISGFRPGFENMEAAATRLRELLADRDILLVVDDVWQAADLMPFLGGGTKCARLVTTRRADTLPSDARAVPVDRMAAAEAVSLLLQGLESAQDLTTSPQVLALVDRLGCWPLLLKLSNAWLRKRVEGSRQQLAAALLAFCQTLEKRGITAFDATNPQARHEAAARTLELSLTGMGDADRARLADIAVFEEDLAIPLVVLDRWWTFQGGLDPFEVDETCQRLFNESLLVECDLNTRFVRMHDVVRSWLRGRLGVTELARLNSVLLQAYKPDADQRWATLADDGYLHRRLPQHLVASGRRAELHALLLDLDWMQLRLHAKSEAAPREAAQPVYSAAADVYGLVSAYDLADAADEDLKLVQRAIRMSTHMLLREPTQLAQQIFGRLGMLAVSAAVAGLCDDARGRCREVALAPLLATLTPPGALELTLQGHEGPVSGAMLLADRKRVLSWSDDGTLRMWDAQQGRLLQTLKAHQRRVSGVMSLGDGQLVLSWDHDDTLRLWDAQQGWLLQTLRGQKGPVNGALLLAEGRQVLSWSDSGTLQLWDALKGQLLLTLHGHEGPVEGALLIAKTQRVLSWFGGTLRLWDMQEAKLLRTLAVHENSIIGAMLLDDDKQMLSWSADGTLKLCSIDRWSDEYLYVLTLRGHKGSVNGAMLLAGGQEVLSWSDDGTLRLWDAQRGGLKRTLHGHDGPVNGAMLLNDGRLVLSWSVDGTLRLWDTLEGSLLQTLEGHERRVTGAILLADGPRVLSWSDDGTLRLWDALKGRHLQTLEGHERRVNGAMLLANGRQVLSWSDDATLRLWDTQQDRPQLPLQGHDGRVTGATLFADGKSVLSWSNDSTLRLWDVEQGRLLQILHGHGGPVEGAIPLADGQQVLSWSHDGTLCLWDAQQCRLLNMFQGHGGWVNGAMLMTDRKRVLSWHGDGTLRLWELQQGQVPQTLGGHDGWINGAMPMANGQLVLSWHSDGNLRLCDAKQGRLQKTLKGHERRVTGAILLADGHRVLSWSDDGTLRLWDVQRGRLLHTLKGHLGPVNGAMLLADDLEVLSWSDDGTLRLWNAQQGLPQASLQGHEGRVTGVTLFADGHRVLSWSDDCTLRLWDTLQGRLLKSLQGHEGPVNGATMLADEQRVLSWSQDGTLRMWDVASTACLHTFRADRSIALICVSEELRRVVAFDLKGRLHLVGLR